MYCNHCAFKVIEDKLWKPQRGIDPAMKRYNCPNCGKQLYILARTVKFPVPTDTA